MDSNPNAFKHGLGPDAVRRIAAAVKRVAPSFPDAAFVRDGIRGLEPLELKPRVFHIVKALRANLPQDVPAAVGVLVRAGTAWQKDETGSGSFFAAWPLIEFVGEHGLEDFDGSMEALRKLTGLFSAEFAIRGFIERDQVRALKTLTAWVRDTDPHVRRLVSEGTRPRLPWGRRLREFQRDPAPVLKLLEKLKDDESEYVRRSVANNLNDIAKDHPQLVVELCTRWARGAKPERKWVIKHATRTLVKQGHAEVLGLLGFDPKVKVRVDGLTLEPSKLSLGGTLGFSFNVRSLAKAAQSLVIDFAIHHVKKTGERTPKVFKLTTLELGAGETAVVRKKHTIRKITTRTYYSGKHAVEVLINGKSHTTVEFDLRVP